MSIGEYIMYLGTSQQINPLQMVKCLNQTENYNADITQEFLDNLKSIIDKYK